MGVVESLVRRLQRIEELLHAVDMLAGPGELVPVDQGVLSLPLHVRHAVRLAEDEVAVDHLELVAVERANGWAGNAVALDVVLAAVARTAVAAGGNRRDHRDALALLAVDLLLLVVLHGAVRLHRAAEVRATVRDDREAGLAAQQAVVADVRGAVRHLAGFRVHEELRHEPLALGEVLQRAQVDLRVALATEGGNDHEADRWHGHETTDHSAQPERRALEEHATREEL